MPPHAWALPFGSRVALSVGRLFPVGLVLGSCLPMAFRSARAVGLEALLPWLWAVNGACSVRPFLCTRDARPPPRLLPTVTALGGAQEEAT